MSLIIPFAIIHLSLIGMDHEKNSNMGPYSTVVITCCAPSDTMIKYEFELQASYQEPALTPVQSASTNVTQDSVTKIYSFRNSDGTLLATYDPNAADLRLLLNSNSCPPTVEVVAGKFSDQTADDVFLTCFIFDGGSDEYSDHLAPINHN